MYTHTYIHTYINIYMHLNTCTCTNMRTYLCMTHTYTHTFKITCVQAQTHVAEKAVVVPSVWLHA